MKKMFIVVDNEKGALKLFYNERNAKSLVASLQKCNPYQNPDSDECYRHVYEEHDDNCAPVCYCRKFEENLTKTFVIVDNETGELKIFSDEEKAKAALARLQSEHASMNPGKDGSYRHVYEEHDENCELDCYCK